MVGADLSMLTVAGSLALLPAVSVAVPGSGWSLPSCVSVSGVVQLAMPEPPVSVHVNVMVTSVLFQPSALLAGTCVCVMVGADLSMRISAVLAGSTLPALSTLHTD